MQILLTIGIVYIIGANLYIAKKKREDEERGVHKHWWEY